MAQLKLARLPDRTPVKVALTMMPDLHQQLLAYTSLYNEIYGTGETMGDLIPAMLTSFLESDRTFVKGQGRSS